MPKKIYKRKLSAKKRSYIQRCANSLERGYYFKEEFLTDQKFTYIDLRSGINDYKLFKKCLKKIRENYFQKAGHPVFGLYERTRFKPFKFHAHLVVAEELKNIDVSIIKKNWLKIGADMGDQTFSVKFEKPWSYNPYCKFFYNLKLSKGQSYYYTKPFGEAGEFDFNINLGSKLPWGGKPMPKDYFHPQKLSKKLNRYFYSQSHNSKRRKVIYSLFDPVLRNF